MLYYLLNVLESLRKIFSGFDEGKMRVHFIIKRCIKSSIIAQSDAHIYLHPATPFACLLKISILMLIVLAEISIKFLTYCIRLLTC